MVEHFDWTIKAGDLLTVLGALFIAGSLLYRRGRHEASSETRGDLIAQGIAEEIEEMKDELHKLAQVITQLAVQDTKITNLMSQFAMLQRNVEDMRRGNGYVGTPARKSVDGEY